MKEIDIQAQETQSPKQDEPKEPEMQKVKDKEKFLKVAREKQLVTKWSSYKIVS